MMSYYKLVEMNNNGVNIRITNDTYDDNNEGGRKWRVSLSKSADGVSLDIYHQAVDLDECVDDVHAKWQRITGQGMPEHKLNILEHHKPETPPAPKSKTDYMTEAERRMNARNADDEIPF